MRPLGSGYMDQLALVSGNIIGVVAAFTVPVVTSSGCERVKQ